MEPSARRSSSKIAQIDAAQLSSESKGFLLPIFKSGAIAVILDGDQRFQRLWDGLMPYMAGADGSPPERPPWQLPLVEIARNHLARGGLDCAGDVIHFTPGRIAYIARKLELSSKAGEGAHDCVPSCFIQDGQRFEPDAEVLQLSRNVAADILQGLVPSETEPPSHRIVIHRLKYEHIQDDIDHLCNLVESASGRWAQLGYRLDRFRETARGPFSVPLVVDVFAILCLAPWLRPALQRINAHYIATDRKRSVPDGHRLIGKPHYDGRIFSALSGDRDTIRTELFDGRNWHEVVLKPGQFLVIPGLSARKFGIRPTLHRVLHTGSDRECRTMNVTLLLGATFA